MRPDDDEHLSRFISKLNLLPDYISVISYDAAGRNCIGLNWVYFLSF
jgi:hypothetical protein